MSYTTYFDAFHCFYHEQPLGLSDYAAGLDRAEDVLNTLDSLGYVQAITRLRMIVAGSMANVVSVPTCLRMADHVRVNLEARGHDLGADRCLARSFALAAYMWFAGVPVELRVGATRFVSRPNAEFHAWVEYRDTPVAPYRETRHVFAIVDSICPRISELNDVRPFF